jgi:hypothetical protein
VAAEIPALDAGKITTGQIALARGGTGADLSATGGANQIVKQSSAGGVFTVAALVAAEIPSLDASKITTGQIALARGGTNADLSTTGGTGQVLKQTSSGGAVSVAALIAADIPALDTSKITTGVFGTGFLGTGTANATTFLRGDGTWAAPSANSDITTYLNSNAGTLNPGTPVYLSSADHFDKAQANAIGTAVVLGLTIASVTTGSAGTVRLSGTLTLTTGQWDAITGQTGGLTAGARYFLDPTTAGKLTTSVTDSTGNFLSRVGQATDTTTMVIETQDPLGL